MQVRPESRPFPGCAHACRQCSVTSRGGQTTKVLRSRLQDTFHLACGNSATSISPPLGTYKQMPYSCIQPNRNCDDSEPSEALKPATTYRALPVPSNRGRPSVRPHLYLQLATLSSGCEWQAVRETDSACPWHNRTGRGDCHSPRTQRFSAPRTRLILILHFDV